jgi:hypothetical protein
MDISKNMYIIKLSDISKEEALMMVINTMKENAKLKTLLMAAITDIEQLRKITSHCVNPNFCAAALEYNVNPYDLCNSCPLSGSTKCKWRYDDEARKVLGYEK